MRLFQPTYTVWGKPNACGNTRETRRSSVWWAEFTVDGKRHKVSTNLRDRNSAEARGALLMREAELRAAGIETHGSTTREALPALLAQYRGELTRRGCAPRHVDTTLSRCAVLTQGIDNVTGLTPTAVRLGLERLRGASAKTINGYRTALSGFCSWLVREGRWPSNPVEMVKRARETSDGPARRALTPDEQTRLLALPDDKRTTIYKVALVTGLRRAELASLTYDDLVGLSPREGEFIGGFGLRVRAHNAKNRVEAVLPLPSGMFLTMYAFPMKVPSMDVFRRDLKAAGIDPTGVDFHSLRVTFATNLARSGAPLALAQRLMRHSDPALTSNIYTQLGFTDEQSAVDRASPDYRGPTYGGASGVAFHPAGRVPGAEPSGPVESVLAQGGRYYSRGS